MKLQNHKTFIFIIFLTLSLYSLELLSQEWTEPVQVSDTIGYHMAPDMCVDSNGTKHVVWSNQLSYPFWKIMYSKSEDNGETWSEDYDISKNDTLWMSQPHIANDSKNNLYVTYDYNTMQPQYMHVLMKIFDGLQWSDSILITEGMPGSDYNKVLVDHLDRVIVFWATNGSYDYYRIYQNGIWGEILEPYFNALPDLYYLYYQEQDTINNVHWIGYTTENMEPGDYAHAYFIYNNEENTWSEPLNLTLTPALIGNDITLNNEYLPAIAIRERTEDTMTYDATLYMNNDGQQWLVPELLVEDPEDQQIVVDQYDRTHVVNREKTPTGYQLVHYRKIYNEWIGLIIDTGYIVQRPKLVFKNNQLSIVYDKTLKVGNNEFIVDIMYSKFDIITNNEELQSSINQVLIYPNPSKGNVNIEFEIHETNSINIIISDFYGRHVKSLLNKKLATGKYKISWDGKNEVGIKVNSSLYLCRLYCGQNIITKSIEIIK